MARITHRCRSCEYTVMNNDLYHPEWCIYCWEEMSHDFDEAADPVHNGGIYEPEQE